MDNQPQSLSDLKIELIIELVKHLLMFQLRSMDTDTDNNYICTDICYIKKY